MQTDPVFTFGVIADIQYCDAEPMYGRYFQASAHKLRHALDTIRQWPLSFILDLDDLIDRDFSSFDTVISLYHTASAPVHFTLGNHAFSVVEDKKKLQQ